ncbi:MAG: DUF2085 domain-containing protein [Bacteroidota bacterium]
MKSALSKPTPGDRWSGAGWALALAAVLVLLVPAVLPPFVGPGVRAVLHAAFDPFCHQLADRSFAVGGVPLALCHRCTGVVAGLALGALALPGLRRWLAGFARYEGLWVLVAVVPAALDWGGGVLGLWANTVGSRFATGLWFGLVIGVLFARALAVRRARPAPASP